MLVIKRNIIKLTFTFQNSIADGCHFMKRHKAVLAAFREEIEQNNSNVEDMHNFSERSWAFITLEVNTEARAEFFEDLAFRVDSEVRAKEGGE